MKDEYAVVVIGGGIAGSALATALARLGARVALVERAPVFRDRVRGEWLAPWGVTEARRLGLADVFASAGAHPVPWNVSRSGKPRRQATPDGDVPLTFFHPALQEALLVAGAETGVDVIRPASLERVRGGDAPAVTVRYRGARLELRASVLVGADGRASTVRGSLGRPLLTHRARRLLAGVRVGGLDGPDDVSHFLIREDAGGLATVYPQGGGYGRVYAFVSGSDRRDFRGPRGFQRFLEVARESGIPDAVIGGARAEGPLAAFVAGDSWTPSPYNDGLALVGDAAGVSDPTWGMGIALALRDARAFAEALRDLGDPRRAAARYACERDDYFATVRTVENWQSELLLTPGAAADERRKRAVAGWSSDASRVPDLNGLGPAVEVSDVARRRFFGEELPAIQGTTSSPADAASSDLGTGRRTGCLSHAS